MIRIAAVAAALTLVAAPAFAQVPAADVATAAQMAECAAMRIMEAPGKVRR